MGRMVLHKREEKPVDKALDWGAKYKDRIETLGKGKPLHFPRWTKHLISGFFGLATLGALSFGAVKTIPYFLVKPVSSHTYEQYRNDAAEERIDRTVARAKLLGTDDKKLTMEQLHEKYIYAYDEQGNVVLRMPEDCRAVVFLFGDSAGRSIMAWSNYFGIDPAIVVAILCAENGQSADPQILNSVSGKFAQNPHLADRTISRSDARGIAQIKPSTAEITVRKLVGEGRWPFETRDIGAILSDYNMSIFLLCALIEEIQTAGYNDIKNIAGIYHSGHNGWRIKKREGENNDEVWKQIKKAKLAMQQYNGVRAYLSKPTQNE